MVDDRELRLGVKVDDKASKPIKQIGDAAEDTTGDLKDMNLGLKKLDDKVAETTKTIGDLRQEISRTGDIDLIKDITKQEQRLKALTRQRKSLLGDVDLKGSGGEAAEDFALSFGARIGPLMARAPISPGLLVAAAGAAPLVSSVIAGAITGGIGTGAVAAGIALAARDSRVQAEAKGLAGEIGETLKEAAGPFVPATIRAIGIVRGEFGTIDDDLKDIFKRSARYVEPLARGAAGFVGELVPGIRDAVSEGEPFFTMLERELPELGRDVGELFSTMADHAKEGAESIGKILDIAGGVADTTGTVTDVLSLLMAIGSFDPSKSSESWDKLSGAWDNLVGNKSKLINLKEDAAGAAGGIRDVGEAATESAVKVETLSAAIDRMGGENLTARAAVRDLEAAYDAASAAVKKNGETLDESTPKGRANAEALDAIVRKAKAARDAIIAQKGSQGEANEVMVQAKENFIRTAIAMGMAAPAAKKLADELFGIPREVKSDVKANTKPARDQVAEYKKWLRSQNLDKTSTITIRQIKESQSARGGNKDRKSVV